MSKPTGLASFTRKKPPAAAPVAVAEPPAAAHAATAEPGSRVRGKGEIVALSFRLTTRQWERVHELAVAERVPIQTLVLRGLSGIFEEKGLPKL